VPATAKAGATVRILAEVKYLVCHEECIPGKAQVLLDLPLSAQAAPGKRQALFAATRAAAPRPASWSGSARIADDRVDITLRGSGLPQVTDAYVAQRKLVNYAPPEVARNGDELKLSFSKSDYFVSAPPQVEFVARAGTQTWSVRVPLSSP
jgi:thiol:disulfide interchange protein DsbD